MTPAQGSEHPRHALDATLSSPVRFSIAAALAGGERVEFGFIRDAVEVTDSTLSKQVSRLEADGLVEVHKGYVGKRPRTWLALTADGAERYHNHVVALQAMIATADQVGEPADQ